MTKEAKDVALTKIALNSLEVFEQVSQAALGGLRQRPISTANALAAANTMAGPSAIQSLDKIDRANRDSWEKLIVEPTIARIVTADSSGKVTTYFICRATAVSNVKNLVSYLAPAGSLASVPIGSELELPNGKVLRVLERAELRPFAESGNWDSRNTVVRLNETTPPLTVISLRALLELTSPETDEVENLVDQILAEESREAVIHAGLIREALSGMELRDQPTLDQYQDQIFRLPLDTRLLVLGPPGTGKTTTLIRRLSQKLRSEFLDEDEQQILNRYYSASGQIHSDSWIMFTPTELLKQYLKEAFNREGVPASDLRIRTWADYRREISRKTLGILRTALDGGAFILRDSSDHLADEAQAKSIEWFTDFDQWQNSSFQDELRRATTTLAESAHGESSSLGKRLSSIVNRTEHDSLANMFISLSSQMPAVQSMVTSIRRETDQKIQGALNLQLNRDRSFLDKMADFLDSLRKPVDDEDEEIDDQDADIEEEKNAPKTRRSVVITTYMRALRASARAHASGKPLAKSSRYGQIIEWLGDRTLDEKVLVAVGTDLHTLAAALLFVNPVRRYISSVPKRYKNFRRQRQEAEQWYLAERIVPIHIHPLELDIVLLTILKNASALLSHSNIADSVEDPAWSALGPVFGLYKSQILVDEAADFSPIQLACMASLSHPKIKSFFACGDFNQRLTTWGSQSVDEFRWIFPDIDVREIHVTYRQSKRLADFANAVVVATGGTDQAPLLPEHLKNEGVAPTLLINAHAPEVIISWLAERIREIERFLGKLPSIAIFVEDETHVRPIADGLNEALSNENARVIACVDGQAVGQDNDVRVFDIQHIKGLEFEAVFFVGIDELEKMKPQLFEKYLYVGATRAATYLGITCATNLPESIAALRPMFVSDWRNS